MKDKQAWLCAQPFICFLGWRCLCMYLIPEGHRRCCWAQQPLSPRGLPACPVRWCSGDHGVPEALLCQGHIQGHCNVSVPAHRLGNAQVPTISKAEGGPGTLLCPCLCTAKFKESRDKEREIISSSSRVTLTHSYLPFLKKSCSETPIISISLSLAFLFWLGAELHLAPLLSFHSKFSCITVMAKEGPTCGKDFWRGQWAAPALGSAQEPGSQAATHLVEITGSLQPLLFSPQQPPEFHWQKKKWGG